MSQEAEAKTGCHMPNPNLIDTLDFMTSNGDEFYVGGREWNERWRDISGEDRLEHIKSVVSKSQWNRKLNVDKQCAGTTMKR